MNTFMNKFSSNCTRFYDNMQNITIFDDKKIFFTSFNFVLSYLFKQSNLNIYFFTFRHRYCIVRPKFWKFIRVQTFAPKI